jgi:hypothetical protein
MAATWRGRGEREGLRARVGPASAVGPEARRRPAGAPIPFSFFNFFSQLFSDSILINLKAFSQFAPRTKVFENKILYNFSLRCNSKFQLEFELQIKTRFWFK